MKLRQRQIKAWEEEHNYYTSLARKLSAIEDSKVGTAAILRRTRTIPNYEQILIEDSKAKFIRRNRHV